ncbi:MAG: DUF4199 domain-containing protein [Bacteroidia bacterium]|jgi:hypothetical protein
MENKKSMWSYALTYGVILGLVSVVVNILFYFISPVDPAKLGSGSSWLQTIIGIAITIAVLIWGTRNYRDEALDGFISYGKSLGFALAIALPYIFIMAIYMFFYVKFLVPDLMQSAMDAQADKLAEQGLSDEEIQTSMKVMSAMGNPIVTTLMGMIGSFFTVLICGLISSIFTKKEAASSI